MVQRELINVATSNNTILIIVDDGAGTFVGSCRTLESTTLWPRMVASCT